MSGSAADRRIRSLRPPKARVDPWRPISVLRERERLAGGGVAEGLTLFLAGAECPFTCVFCDLWRHTLDGPTPPGAIPRQIDVALEELEGSPPRGWIKLYNASNFFDRRAVPPDDWEPIAERLAPFDRVIVESHPKLVREAPRFAELLSGKLEVAMGLETGEPRALALLNKQMTVEDFDRAARSLRDAEIDLRVFVLLGHPFVPEAESVEWTVRSVGHAVEAGARAVSIIPMRGGNGEMERLGREGEFREPTLAQLEEAFDRCVERNLDRSAVIQVDTWDLGRFALCERCSTARIERLVRWNLGEPVEKPETRCPACGEPAPAHLEGQG